MAQNLGDKHWYIVTTYSGNEAKTAENLQNRIKTMNMEAFIFRVLVAEFQEKVIDPETGEQKFTMDKKTGEKVYKFRTRNLYPGYFFVEMIMTTDSWFVVRNTPGVTGIAGSSGGGQMPTPLSPEEIEPVLKRMGQVDASMYDRYAVGDQVKIISGPLEGTEGEITSINKETGACTVNTVFFGRVTPVDVEFSEIEKI
ncbi:MAG: transcription termination/antitermination protein NusG [Erysipelotrichaceae bacterium]|nr:transcription termination/antitermination protein NusG [Erysipelotrichaceae bacterium]